MSEEEQNAIEDIDLFVHCLNYGEQKMTIASERQKEIAQELQVLLNLIEELKEKNNQLTNYLNDSYYVSADKIREKIKKAKEIKWQIPKLVIEYFEELLEEN